jgi:hypothetical protein
MSIKDQGAVTATRHKPRSWWNVHFGSIRFYLMLVLAALVLHASGAVVGSISDALPNGPLSDEFKKRQIDLWAEMNKLLIALATVVIGGIGGFVVKRENPSMLETRQMRRAAAGWIFCALSLYFGYLSYHEASVMLSYGVFDAKSPRLWWPTRAQFWTFLTSVILFADLVYGSARSRRQS